ncbi:MAG: thioredoxin domain-containing protein, partial [Desulfurococcales archaeon]|nr:thioredoxin domain-containing protein [Desulfurococcales archaeon]
MHREGSLYLRQHACNPVDWNPWSDEALSKAKALDKPLFISIGYSTCHWCHVMARESFSDPEVARLMNRVFINIKVDREERPDIDEYYMTYCQVSIGSCGWPLNVVALPDGRPFYVFTYLPRESLIELIKSIEEIWLNNRGTVERVAERAWAILDSIIKPMTGDKLLSSQEAEKLYKLYNNSFDRVYGGFGSRPKFPMHYALLFLTRYAHHYGVGEPLEIVRVTLDSMLRGGIWDHVDYGLHRYSTDRYWHLPHFEKMLYDQASLIKVLVEAGLAMGSQRYLKYAYRIYEFLARDMTVGEGFASALSAESNGVEGLYYTFTLDEVEEALGADAGIAANIFGFKAEGNYLDEATGRPTGRNIVYMALTIEEIAGKYGLTIKQAEELVEDLLSRLRVYRRERKPRPDRDEKVVTSWNAMTVSALAQLYMATDGGDVLYLAEQVYNKLAKTRWVGGLLHTVYPDGKQVEGFLEDYAYMIDAAITLYQATFKPRYLEDSIELVRTLKNKLWKNNTLLYMPEGINSPLSGKPADPIDTSYQNGYSITIESLIKLYRLTGELKYIKDAETLL